MPDIVIHGASSFIGKHFLKRLSEEKIPVKVFAREDSILGLNENVDLIKVFRYKNELQEILNHNNFNISNPVFYEFSWFGVYGDFRNSSRQITVNIPLIISSLKFANEIKAKHWIGIGSQAEYGNLNKKISEEDVCKPTTLYGKSKLICSQISDALCRDFGMEYTWLRLFSVFGPDDNNDWLIPYLIKYMSEEKEINTTKGEQSWDYLYIDDIVDVLTKLIHSKGLGIVNLGSGKSVQVKFIIEKIKELTNSGSKINLGAIPYRNDQVMHMQADIKKLSELLDWKPKTGIEEGLLKTIKYFTGNKT